MRPGEVLDARGDLTDRLVDHRFATIVDRLGEFEFGRSGGKQDKRANPLSELLAKGLTLADTYRVTHDMSLMVEHVAMELDGTDQFHSDLAPSPCGFVSFDRPLPVVDQRGKTMLLHYIVWGPINARIDPRDESGKLVALPRSERATLMVGFNDTWRQPDQVADELRENFIKQEGATEKRADEYMNYYRSTMGRWATVGASTFFDTQRLGPAFSLPDEKAQAKLISEGFTPHEGHNVIRYLHALWLMMGQTVAKVAPEEVDRTARRRAEKRRIPPSVTVIKLRRETDSVKREGESEVEWAHRWIVKGHLRWQPYGHRGAEHEHVLGPMAIGTSGHPERWCVHEGCDHHVERIYIHPYMKNAHRSDLPIVQTDKVYSLER